MIERGQVTIRPKTSEQLAKQVRRAKYYWKHWAGEKLIDDKEQLPEDPAKHTSYSRYLQGLREIRQSSGYKKLYGVDDTRSADGKVRKYDPFIALDSMEDLTNWLVNHANLRDSEEARQAELGVLSGKDLTRESLAEIVKDKASAVKFLDEIFSTYKGTFHLEPGTIKAIKSSFSLTDKELGQMLTHRLEVEKNYFRNLLFAPSTLKTMARYVNKEDLKAFLVRAAKTEETSELNPMKWFFPEIYTNETLLKVFSKKDFREIASAYIHNHVDVNLERSGFEDRKEVNIPVLVEDGILDEELLEFLVFHEIKDLKGNISTAFSALACLPNLDRAKVTTALIEAFKNASLPVHVEALQRYANDFVPEDQRADFYLRLQKSVEEAFEKSADATDFKHLVYSNNFLSKEKIIDLIFKFTKLNPNYVWSEDYIKPQMDFDKWKKMLEIALYHGSFWNYWDMVATIAQNPSFSLNEKQQLFEKVSIQWEESLRTVKYARDVVRSSSKPEVHQLDLEMFPEDYQRQALLIYIVQRGGVARGNLSSQVLITLANNLFAKKYIEEAIIHWSLLSHAKDLSKQAIESMLEVVRQEPLLAAEQIKSIMLVLNNMQGETASRLKLEIFQLLAAANPFSIYYLSKIRWNDLDKIIAQMHDDIGKEKIIQLATAQADKLPFGKRLATRWLRRFCANDLDSEGKAAKGGYRLWDKITVLHQESLDHTIASIVANDGLSIAQEEQLIDILYAVIELKQNMSRSDLQSISSVKEAKDYLAKTITSCFNLDVAASEIDQFVTAMESIVPFALYVGTYYENKEMNKLLGEMFTAITKGDYLNWRFGKRDELALQELKNKQLMPKNLTFDQYDIWQRDNQSNYFDSISADYETVAANVKAYILQNTGHLDIDTEKLKNALSAASPEGYIYTQVMAIGKEIQRINSEKEADTDVKDALKRKRKECLRIGDFLKFCNLSRKELLTGKFASGKTLLEELNRLRGSASSANSFIYDYITSQITQLSETVATAQNLYCADSSDPKVTLEIGETPVPSCQHYENGEYNGCLLGYTEPNTKILIARNEKGNIIARSIFRLLTDSNGQPALHVERIYAAVASSAVPRIIYSHAIKKAEEMGMRVFVNKWSETEEGVKEEALLARGFKLTPVPKYTLSSFASRAPALWVDSVSGGLNNGVYTIDDLLEIKRDV